MKQKYIAQLAYLAGIVDGEGSFILSYRQRMLNGYLRNSYEQKISISQKDGRIMDWLKGTFGGFVRWQKIESHMYQWIITDYKAYELTKRMLPFLRYKNDQARLFIRYFERRKCDKSRDRFNRFSSLSEHEIEEREKLIREIKSLKHSWRECAAVETKCEDSSNEEKL
ncbi:MAG: LAGLIDADG family homing endonuclease [Nostocales cyanobacterium 94392]|nr:LAGLIDADG family homing endonuclease [Nostocales cyanobacterium 94392]